jgi:hypothetical protein
MKRLLGSIALILTLCCSTSNAWDGAATGPIAQLDVVTGPGGAPGNYDVRVYLTGYPIMCSGGAEWAYLNSTDANYNTLSAALMMAKATGSNVRVFSLFQYGQCRIGYVMVY